MNCEKAWKLAERQGKKVHNSSRYSLCSAWKIRGRKGLSGLDPPDWRLVEDGRAFRLPWQTMLLTSVS